MMIINEKIRVINESIIAWKSKESGRGPLGKFVNWFECDRPCPAKFSLTLQWDITLDVTESMILHQEKRSVNVAYPTNKKN